MSEEIFIIPSNEDGYVNLSRTRSGRLFKKHLLSTGELLHPVTGKKIIIDDEFLNIMKRNFDDKVCPIVQIPVADDYNRHSEDPTRNIGEVVDVQIENGKLYAFLDIRDASAADKLGKTMLGASAMLATNYKNTKTGEMVGPALLHSCVTNRPYCLDLEDYSEVLLSNTTDSTNEAVVLSSATETETEMPRSLEELLKELKDGHDIDVDALTARVTELEETSASLSNSNTELESAKAEIEAEKSELEAERDEAVRLSSELTEALEASGVVKLSNGDVTPADVVGAIAELAQGHLALSNQVKELAEKDAGYEVQDLVDAGKVPPTQKSWLVNLKLSAPTQYTEFLATLPETPAVVMDKEEGKEPPATEQAQNKWIEEIARLTSPGGAAYNMVHHTK